MAIKKHAWALWGIVFVVVIALMILIPFRRTNIWWIAAACTVFMFGLCAFAFSRAFGRDNTLESKLLGWPIFKVGYIALIAQLIVGAILMAISTHCPIRIAVIVELLVFAITGVCMIMRDAVREAVTVTEENYSDATAIWKAIRLKAATLAVETDSVEIKQLVDMIKFADPTPTSVDGELAEALEMLSLRMDDTNLGKALRLMNTRNLISKEEKRNEKSKGI